MSIKILLSLEHNIYRSSLKKLLEQYDDIYVEGDTCFFDDVENMLSKRKYDIIITDMHVKNMLWVDILKRISLNKEIGIIVLFSTNDISRLKEVFTIQYSGVVALSSEVEKLVDAIHTVYSKKRYIDQCFNQNGNVYMNDKINLLTNRELEVLKFIGTGCFNKEIASKMDITERTVKNYVSSIFKKIEVCDRTQAAIFAIRNNIVIL